MQNTGFSSPLKKGILKRVSTITVNNQNNNRKSVKIDTNSNNLVNYPIHEPDSEPDYETFNNKDNK